jgi:hypothetical protein
MTRGWSARVEECTAGKTTATARTPTALSQAGILDTGPSGITTAIGAWLLARRHAYATLSLLTIALTVAAFLQPNIDGREHETAMLVGVLAAVAQARIRTSSIRLRRRGQATNETDSFR